MELFRWTSSEQAQRLLHKLRQEQRESEQRMAAFYNFDFQLGIPISSPTPTTNPSAATHPGPRFIWEPIHTEAGAMASSLAPFREMTNDPMQQHTDLDLAGKNIPMAAENENTSQAQSLKLSSRAKTSKVRSKATQQFPGRSQIPTRTRSRTQPTSSQQSVLNSIGQLSKAIKKGASRKPHPVAGNYGA